MATPPPVSAADAATAIERITSRRAQIDDANAWRLSDEPAEVLLYLRRYSSGIPHWVAEADILDGLTLRLRLWWLGEEAELWLLERARRLDIPPRVIAPRLGIGSRQGVHDRLRLAREKVSRLLGTPLTVAGKPSDQDGRTAERAWMTANRDVILEIGRAAVQYRALGDDEAAEWLADVARDVQERAVTLGSVQVLRFALIELSTSPQVTGLDASHPLRQLLQRWSQLYSSYPGAANHGR